MEATLLCALALFAAGSEPMFDDHFASDAQWDLIDMKGDAEMVFSASPNTPPPYGGTPVLHINGDHVIGLARGVHLESGTVVLLYRERQPRDRDGDGLLVFGAAYPDDVSTEQNTKVATAASKLLSAKPSRWASA